MVSFSFPQVGQGLGSGFEPITSSGAVLPGNQAINCTSIPIARNAACRVVKVGVSLMYPEGGMAGFGPVGTLVKTPTPITCTSKWLAILASFRTVQPASLNNGRSCLAKLNVSSPPADVYPKSTTPFGNGLRVLTKLIHCWSVSLRGLMRSLRSSKSFSAVAALACCLLIPALASATSFSSVFELSTNRTISASLAWSTRRRAGPAIKPRTNSAATPTATKRAEIFCPFSIQESSVGSSTDYPYRDLSVGGLAVIWLIHRHRKGYHRHK